VGNTNEGFSGDPIGSFLFPQLVINCLTIFSLIEHVYVPPFKIDSFITRLWQMEDSKWLSKTAGLTAFPRWHSAVLKVQHEKWWSNWSHSLCQDDLIKVSLMAVWENWWVSLSKFKISYDIKFIPSTSCDAKHELTIFTRTQMRKTTSKNNVCKSWRDLD
jgi:hypothetical protein